MRNFVRKLGLMAALLSPVAIAPSVAAQEICVSENAPVVCSKDLENKLREKSQEEIEKTKMVPGLWRNINNFDGNYDNLTFVRKDEGDLTIRYWVEGEDLNDVQPYVVDYITKHLQESHKGLNETIGTDFNEIDVIINLDNSASYVSASAIIESNTLNVLYGVWKGRLYRGKKGDRLARLTASHELSHVQKYIHTKGYENKDTENNKMFREVIGVLCEALYLKNSLDEEDFRWYLNYFGDRRKIHKKNRRDRIIGVNIFNEMNKKYGEDVTTEVIADLTTSLINNLTDFDKVLSENGISESFANYSRGFENN
jgi:hypothetical protein